MYDSEIVIKSPSIIVKVLIVGVLSLPPSDTKAAFDAIYKSELRWSLSKEEDDFLMNALIKILNIRGIK